MVAVVVPVGKSSFRDVCYQVRKSRVSKPWFKQSPTLVLPAVRKRESNLSLSVRTGERSRMIPSLLLLGNKKGSQQHMFEAYGFLQ